MNALALATKRCTVCGEIYPSSRFYKNSTLADGLARVCIDCTKARVAESQARQRRQMGDDAYRMQMRERVRRSRAKNGAERERLTNQARATAIAALIETHRSEYEALYRREKHALGLLKAQRADPKATS